MRNTEKYGKIVLHVLIMIYGLSMVFLFYQQTRWNGGSVYESDLPAHIQMITEDGWYYSLTAFVYQALYLLPFGNMAVSVFLAVCGTASVYLTALLLEKIKGNDENKLSALSLAGGLILNLVMPCYIRGVADGRYIGMEAASIWHNSTYIVMKPVALCCVLYFAKLSAKYKTGISAGDWIGFSMLLSVCTAVKPSFFIVFAPAMAILLLWDFCHGVSFSHVFVFGSTVFLSLFVILFQNMILFGGGTGNGWEFRPGYALSLHSGHPFIAAALSIFFPLIVLLQKVSRLKMDRCFSGAWLMAGIGFLELFLFSETGGRASDGNFMWGYSFAILMIFAVSFVEWTDNVKIFFHGKKERKQEGTRQFVQKGYLLVSGLIFFWHVYCGIYFYSHLLQGVSYWMWD